MCIEWASNDECDKNPEYMRESCMSACNALDELKIKEDEISSGLSSFYDLSAKDIDGNVLDFNTLRGNVVIIVNVASYCGYTNSHYSGLVELYNGLASTEMLKILAFPCNQFGDQEPDECPVIKKFAQDKGAEFTVMDKIDVNGPNANMVYKYLKKEAGVGSITWNFATYFVVSPTGVIDSHTGIHPLELNGIARSLMGEEL